MAAPIKAGAGSRSSDRPCGICGQSVYVQKVRGERSLGEVTAPLVDVRVCSNPDCGSNTGTRRLGEAV